MELRFSLTIDNGVADTITPIMTALSTRAVGGFTEAQDCCIEKLMTLGGAFNELLPVDLFKDESVELNRQLKDLQDLIDKAQLNILPSFNATGVKLKVINALFMGKHCITNQAGVEGSGLENLCHICNTAEEINQKIEELVEQPITQTEIDERQSTLHQIYNNEENAKKLVQLIWENKL